MATFSHGEKLERDAICIRMAYETRANDQGWKRVAVYCGERRPLQVAGCRLGQREKSKEKSRWRMGQDGPAISCAWPPARGWVAQLQAAAIVAYRSQLARSELQPRRTDTWWHLVYLERVRLFLDRLRECLFQLPSTLSFSCASLPSTKGPPPRASSPLVVNPWLGPAVQFFAVVRRVC